ncbi:MAG: MFS transporter, partial [Actinobacteria bacterium]|nr:MFS transporter [Actinomycetota bacterium]
RHPRRYMFGLAGGVLSTSYLLYLPAGSQHGDGGAVAIGAVAIVYTLGEILYTGVSTALVIDAAPAHLRGRALARWQLSLGLGRAIAPLAITAALGLSATALWMPLAVATVVGAAAIMRYAPTDSSRS